MTAREKHPISMGEAWKSRMLEMSEPDFSGAVIWASEKGVSLLEQQIQKVQEMINETRKQLGEVAEGGHDLPENLAFKETMVKLRFVLPRQLDDLRKKQSKTVPFQQARWFKNHDFQTITLGTKVSVISGDGKEESLNLLGTLEVLYGQTTRPISTISYDSPLGKALLGQRTGNVVRLENGLSFKILATEQVISPQVETNKMI